MKFLQGATAFKNLANLYPKTASCQKNGRSIDCSYVESISYLIAKVDDDRLEELRMTSLTVWYITLAECISS